MSDLKKGFDSDGFAVARAVFSPQEVTDLRDHYMHLRLNGRYPGDMDGVATKDGDPLLTYPRMIHMHRWDEKSLRWVLDERLNRLMTEFLGVEPFAVQTMLYFKPPGARGQALHQDQFYLRAKPGTCIAAWLALDDCDEENGCMQVVPGTQDLPILCAQEADTSQSFTDVTVPVPKDYAPVPVPMKAGDVMFFNGQVIHGSFPNRSTTRFRRALIGHYITGNAQQVAHFFHPVLRMDGTVVELEAGPGGGPCGVFVDGNAKQEIVMREPQSVGPAHE